MSDEYLLRQTGCWDKAEEVYKTLTEEELVLIIWSERKNAVWTIARAIYAAQEEAREAVRKEREG